MPDDSNARGVAAKPAASSGNPATNTSRRAFGKQFSVAATAAAAALGGMEPASAQPGMQEVRFRGPSPENGLRLKEAFDLRVAMATHDASLGRAVDVTNGDGELYPDRAGTYTKGLLHDSYGRVDPASFASFQKALSSGKASDFESIIIGGTRTLNGPQGGLCFQLDMMDACQFGQPQVPPAPALAGDQTAAELMEHYWCALLRDVPYTQFDSNPTAAQASAELSAQASYTGPRDSHGTVTPGLLFRGGFPGETLGPYISQFMLQSAFMGPQPIVQQQWTYLPNIDYATDFASWLDLQNGVDTGLRNQMDSQYRFRRNGRDLTAVTHMDVLFQEYFVAFLVLATINATPPGSFTFGGAPYNPGNPYNTSRTQNGFGTLGGPDMAAAIEEVAVKALNTVWYQKWFVHLRPRPESVAGLVHLLKTGQQDKTSARLSPAILNSQALQASYNRFGSYLLPQSFPEGSPTHPAYPTGHGTIAGACITVLKFFFDGDYVIPNPVVSSEDGLALVPYTGADAGMLTVNGELNKLGHNVSFGHGIHAGIHWRSDTDTSLLLGEAVGLSYLRNKARTYNEPFTVHLTKFDGTVETITNQGNP